MLDDQQLGGVLAVTSQSACSRWVWSASAVTTVAARSRRPAAAGTGRSVGGVATRFGRGPPGWCGPSPRAGGPVMVGGRCRAGSCRRPRPPAAAGQMTIVDGRWRVAGGQPSAGGAVRRVGVDAGKHAAHGRLPWLPARRRTTVAGTPARPVRTGTHPRSIRRSRPGTWRWLAPRRLRRPRTPTSVCRRPRCCLGRSRWAREPSRLRHWSPVSAAAAAAGRPRG